MDKDFAIKVENVSKKYCKSLKRSMLYGIKDIARNTFGLSSHSDKLRKNEFWAVDDISFEVKKGETLGIIGPNGSGKTTLLKMLNGIFWPDKGKISVKGKVGALIEVGAGFHPLLTGRENIYINAAILGMTKKEVDEKFDDIVEFADIGDFLDAPVKHYSSGMFVRLGFAVAVHCEPDILLVDEVLAVGDVDFQSKCFNKMGEIRKSGATVVMVTHSMAHILGFCDNAFYINGGKTIFYGMTAKAIELYQQDILSKKEQYSLSKFNKVRGTGKARFTKIEFLDENKKMISQVNAEDELIVRLHYYANEDIGPIEVDVAIRGHGGEIFFRASSKVHGKKLLINKGDGCIDVVFKSLRANNQMLMFYFSLWKEDRSELLDWKRDIPFYVMGNPKSGGIVVLNMDWVNNRRYDQ